MDGPSDLRLCLGRPSCSAPHRCWRGGGALTAGPLWAPVRGSVDAGAASAVASGHAAGHGYAEATVSPRLSWSARGGDGPSAIVAVQGHRDRTRGRPCLDDERVIRVIAESDVQGGVVDR